MRPPFAPCLAAALAIALPTAARAAAVAIPAPSVENIGGTVIVRQSDGAASLVGVTLIVRAGLDRQSMRQNGLAALVAETIVRTPVNGRCPGRRDRRARRIRALHHRSGRRALLRRGARPRRSGGSRPVPHGARGAGLLAGDDSRCSRRARAADRAGSTGRAPGRNRHAQRCVVAAGQRRSAGARHARIARAILLRGRALVLSRVLSPRRSRGQRRRAARRAGTAVARRPRRRAARRNDLARSGACSPAQWSDARDRRASRHRLALADRAVSRSQRQQP